MSPTYAFRPTIQTPRGARLKQHIDQGGTPETFPGRVTDATRRWARDKGMKFEAESVPKPPRKHFSDDDDKTLLEHHSKGFSTRDIAEKMGTTKNSIIGRLDRIRKSQEGVETKPSGAVRKTPGMPRFAFMEKPMDDE